MQTTGDIRRQFLEFFENKGHSVVASSSLVPSNDPTLMFTNSGMVQFKNVFLDTEKRDYTRATTSQRCVRAGGKHNDLDNVGHTARHHTFFEMLGNFSFGDYFKEEVIPWAWEFLTSPEWLNLPKDKLYVTVYHTDDEAYDIWHKKVGLPEDRIIRITTNDNFWSMGDDGPCGPSSEIFYDHGAEIEGGLPGTPEEDGDRYIEIWNLVFMQNIMEGGKIVGDLPKKCVDTGMGLERITAVMQHVHNNYETDVFMEIIGKAADLASIDKKTWLKKSDIEKINQAPEMSEERIGYAYDPHVRSQDHLSPEETLPALRVVADHLRCMSFLMVDGVMPSNEGRGYVLRRIMRRAMRYVNMLGVNEPFIYKLVPTLVKAMGDAYPELKRGETMVADMIKIEEERFGRTLSQGLKMLEEETADMEAGDVLSGAFAFKLYDTYGFPLDLTQDALRRFNLTVDEAEFNSAMEAQRARARAAHKGSGDSKISDVWFDIQATQPATEFLGYEKTGAESELQAIVANGEKVETAQKGQKVHMVFNQTPFYAESGGQVGDSGEISTETGKAIVTDTQKLLDGHFFAHVVEVKEGEIKTGQAANLQVDEGRRTRIRNNHSATHLMDAALIEILGDHVHQKGSIVTDEKLRFDFSHPKAVTAEELLAIENRVNQMIWENAPVSARIMPKEDAIKAGAIAMFGEKYGDDVRVISMGFEGVKPQSIELCGGTHVPNTGVIGLFKITAESSISAGVRRIEAVTGQAAVAEYRKAENTVTTMAGSLRSSPAELSDRVDALLKEKKKLEADLKQAQKGGGNGGAAALVQQAEDVDGVKWVRAVVPPVAPNLLREMVDEVKNALGSGVVLLATENDGKSTFVAGVTADLTNQFKAGEIVKAAAAEVGGKGGGKPDMAMAGGPAGDLQKAISANL